MIDFGDLGNQHRLSLVKSSKTYQEFHLNKAKMSPQTKISKKKLVFNVGFHPYILAVKNIIFFHLSCRKERKKENYFLLQTQAVTAQMTFPQQRRYSHI